MPLGLIRPAVGEVLHFSEDPTITSFSPREAYVWAVDQKHAPSYWFPRNCPRVLTWATPTTTAADQELLLGTSWRVHAIEYAWLSRLQSTVLYAYRFAASDFAPFGTPEPHAQVSSVTVRSLGPPENVGSLLEAHASAGIELRLFDNLWPYWRQVLASSIGFSGIRMRNAQPATDST